MGVSYDLPDGVRPLFAHDLDLSEGHVVCDQAVFPLVFIHVTDDDIGAFAVPFTPKQALMLASGLLAWAEPHVPERP